MQARWPREKVRIERDATRYVRVSGGGAEAVALLLPALRRPMYYWTDPQKVPVPVAAFADPRHSPSRISVDLTGDAGVACGNWSEHECVREARRVRPGRPPRSRLRGPRTELAVLRKTRGVRRPGVPAEIEHTG